MYQKPSEIEDIESGIISKRFIVGIAYTVFTLGIISFISCIVYGIFNKNIIQFLLYGFGGLIGSCILCCFLSIGVLHIHEMEKLNKSVNRKISKD